MTFLSLQQLYKQGSVANSNVLSARLNMFPILLLRVQLAVQVELAALEYRSSRLVRVLDTATGQRMGFGEGGATEVVSAR